MVHRPAYAGAVSCLDIGGSHGYVGAMLCAKHPPMRCTVLDRAEALAPARSIGAGQAWASLVSFREGNLLTADFGAGHGVVLLSNVLHHFSPEANLGILRRVRQALAPGGTVSIFEIETPAAGQPPEAASDALALYFRITSTAACFGADDYLGWLTAAGFSSARVVRSVRMPSRMLVVASA